jgi:hypothetical protein
MAWTTPRTWTAGETVTASVMNTHVRDNLDYLKGVVQGTRVRRSSTYSMATGTTDIPIPWTAEDFDDGNWHDNSTNNTRITVSEAGLYLIIGQLTWVTNGTGYRVVGIRLDGSTILSRTQSAPAGTYTSIHTTTIHKASAGAYYEVVGVQNSGGALDVVGDYWSLFEVVRLA